MFNYGESGWILWSRNPNFAPTIDCSLSNRDGTRPHISTYTGNRMIYLLALFSLRSSLTLLGPVRLGRLTGPFNVNSIEFVTNSISTSISIIILPHLYGCHYHTASMRR